MFGRFLSFLGFIPGLSGLSGLAGGYGSGYGSGAEEGLDADGEAAVSFTPGRQLASADAEETPDSRRARITDRDLVWPGKIETIQISNPEPIAYRFDLTVTDLNPAFYIRRPPMGGVPQREGGILLQPGEDASFEVVFVPPPAGEKQKTQTFGFVLTYFDPRRSGDPGQIVQELPLRWVALPTEKDLQITAAPPVVVTRPWRREARFAVQFANKSFLPPTVGMTILRAPTKDALEREAETVGAVQQSLAARTPGVWQCLLPPSSKRGSYFATVRGAAQAAESVSTPLALPRPVLIRYVPWLRMGRDWAFLLGLLLFLAWALWGIPVRKTPTVRVQMVFNGLEQGQVPADGKLQDLTAQMILLDERGHDMEGQQPIPGVVIDNAFEFNGPAHWYGFRWLFGRNVGWNGWSRESQRFRVTVAAAEAEKSAFRRYDLSALQPDGKQAYNIESASSPFGPWTAPGKFSVPAARGVLVSMRLGRLGALTGKTIRKVSVTYTLNGQQQPPRTFELMHEPDGSLRPIVLDLTDAIQPGTSVPFTVNVTANNLTSYDISEMTVKRQDKPFPVSLVFPDTYPKTVSRTPVGPATGSQNTGGAGTGGKGIGGKGTGGAGIGGAGTGGKGTGGKPSVKSVTPVQRGKLPIGGNNLLKSNHHIQAITYPPPPLPPPPVTEPPINVVSPPAGPPSVPTGLTAQPIGPSQINVHWRPVPDATRYVLYRSGGPGRGGGEEHLEASQTSFSDTGLTPGVVYHYRIQSKRGAVSSAQSEATSTLTPPLMTVPATVSLALTPERKDVRATLSFTNVSSHDVYLDKVSACADGKIGDDLFHILADGQPVPFSGKKTKRRSDPGPRQFIKLVPGENVIERATLNRSYRFPSGTHTYSVTYTGSHLYPARLQSLTLSSNEESLTTAR